MSDPTNSTGDAGHPAVRTGVLLVWLAVLTAAEIAVAYLPLATMTVAFSLVAMALVKAALVMIWFMHLRFEHRMVWAIALVPLVLGAALAVGLAPEAGYVRDLEEPTANLVQHRRGD